VGAVTRTGHQWISAMADRGGLYATVAAKLHAMVLFTDASTRHQLAIESEYLRRRVLAAARWGHMPQAMLPCSACGCQALFADWFASAFMAAADREMALLDLRGSTPIEVTAYMRDCPGQQYAADVAASPYLPTPRRQR
jgi:hypothetical protein